MSSMIGTGLKVDAPEGVSFSYELASLADRAKAYLIDLLLRVAAMVVIGIVFLLALGPVIWAGIGLWLVIYFAVEWGFYVFFELIWDGQSPGKRILDLRVVKVAGHPVGFFDSVLRNLLRTADQLPLTYGVGSLAMLMTGRFQRLGDLAAGTVVVREAKAWYGMRSLQGASAPTAESLVAKRVSLSNRERRLLQEFVARKDRLHPERAEQLAEILARPYAERFGLPMPARATDLLQQLVQGGPR
ncbi:MAG: RDD family protein [Myxococcales bacterium]|nr:RDD family protein [Myxococcales bacterium]